MKLITVYCFNQSNLVKFVVVSLVLLLPVIVVNKSSHYTGIAHLVVQSTGQVARPSAKQFYSRPVGDLCRRAVDRGNDGATTRRPSPATR